MKKKISFPLAITFIAFSALLLIVVILQYGLIPGIKLPTCCLGEPLERPLLEQPSWKITEDDIADCKTDFDCFIKASKGCNQAKMTHTSTVNIFGMIQTTTSFFEIKGIEEDKCIFYIRNEKNDLKFSDEIIQQMLANGITQEQIQEQEQEANKNADLAEGIDGTCRFNTNDLTLTLNKWKMGEFSTDDYSIAECSGKMFK